MTRHEAVDPSSLQEGDDVHIQDVAGELELTGEVEKVRNEWGRIGVDVESEEYGLVTAWEETGRTYTRILEEASA